MTSFALHNAMELPAETNLAGRPPGVTRRILHSASDGSVTWLLEFPRGYRSEWGRGREGELESHDSTEEVIVLEGSLGFGNWYEMGPLHYSLHPAGWLHPAHQHSVGGCTLIIRRDSSEINFNFEPAPDGWNSRQDASHRLDITNGLVNLGLKEHVEMVASQRGEGVVARQLSDSLVNDMRPYVVSIPAGWKDGEGTLGSHGSETLVLEGHAEVRSTQLGDVALGPYGYLIGSPESHDELVGSKTGALLLRWTRFNDVQHSLTEPLLQRARPHR